MLKTSEEIKKWFKNSKSIKRDFGTTAMLMEKGGTGGALFRNLYRDFLKESYELLHIKQIDETHNIFSEVATLWTKVSTLLNKAAETQDFEHINQASKILADISNKEKIAMGLLTGI